MTPAHIKFIQLVAGGETFERAYATTCNKKTTSANARAMGSRLAKRYKKDIQSEREKLQNAISYAHENESVKTAFKAVLSKAERINELSSAANDLLQKVQGKKQFTFFSGGKMMQSHNGEKFMLPVDTQLKILEGAKNLIAELNKMDGSYAATKNEIDINQPFLFKVGYGEEDE